METDIFVIFTKFHVLGTPRAGACAALFRLKSDAFRSRRLVLDCYMLVIVYGMNACV